MAAVTDLESARSPPCIKSILVTPSSTQRQPGRNLPSPTVPRPRPPLAAVFAAAMLLAGCEATPPPAAEPAALPTPPRLVLAPPLVAARRTVSAAWTFRSDETACLASASHPDLSLSVTVRQDGPVELVLRPGRGARPALRPNAAVQVAFSGKTLSWRERGRTDAAGGVTLSRPLNEFSVSRVLQLLAGGTIETGGAKAELPLLRLPDGGTPGRVWFECVRRQLFS